MADNRAPPPTQQTGPDSVIFQKFVGIKNTVSRERLGQDEFESAINIDLDDAGQVRRRRGMTLAAAGNYSSLFNSNEGIVYGVVNGSLGIINPNFSFNVLQSGFPTTWNPLAYVQLGDSIYFSSRTNSGIIQQLEQLVVPWAGPNLGGNPPTPMSATRTGPVAAIPNPNFWYSPVTNPNLNSPPVGGKLLGPPPLAEFLAYFNGRIYLGVDNMVWYTRLWNYLYVDMTHTFWQFEAPITMIGSVTDGLYVGTQEGVWFISGRADEPRRVRVMDSGAIKGSMVYIPGELANPPQVGLQANTKVQVSILFLTSAGYCGGMDGGVCYNYTEDKFVFPGIESAQAMYRLQDGVHQYIAVGNSRGTPAANSRIGDHVDVTIRRGGEWNLLDDQASIGDKLTFTYIPA